MYRRFVSPCCLLGPHALLGTYGFSSPGRKDGYSSMLPCVTVALSEIGSPQHRIFGSGELFQEELERYINASGTCVTVPRFLCTSQAPLGLVTACYSENNASLSGAGLLSDRVCRGACHIPGALDQRRRPRYATGSILRFHRCRQLTSLLGSACVRLPLSNSPVTSVTTNVSSIPTLS